MGIFDHPSYVQDTRRERVGPMVSALQVAEYFLWLMDEEAGDLISNLKLQKLLYYAQGFHVALYNGQPLFKDPMKAWMHGPVVPEVYNYYSRFGSNAIPRPKTNNFNDPEKQDFLEEVYSVYGQFSAWKLRSMTHEEPPWENTIRGETISLDLLEKYFSTQIL